MQILTRAGREVTLRTWGVDTSVAPSPTENFSQQIGATPMRALGLPSVMAAVRLISDSIAAMPIKVYERAGELDRQPATASAQYQLLHVRPNLDQSAFEFIQDLVVSLECFGNAYVLKTVARGQVQELRVLNAQNVKPTEAPDGSLIFEAHSGGETRLLTSKEIIHIRGLAPFGGLVGSSPLMTHKNAIGNALAVQEYAGRYFANDATPGMILKMPQTLNAAQAEEIGNQWNSAHRGLRNARKTAVLGGGADVQLLATSMQDAQFAELSQLGIEDVARVFAIPSDLLSHKGSDPQKIAEHFLKFCLAPRLRRIEAGLLRDADLFPPSANLYPEFTADALLRPATRERFEAYRAARQAGWLSPNEIRALESYPPTAGGEQIQMTPVGGAPNPVAGVPTSTN